MRKKTSNRFSPEVRQRAVRNHVYGNVGGDAQFEINITVNGTVPLIADDFYL